MEVAFLMKVTTTQYHAWQQDKSNESSNCQTISDLLDLPLLKKSVFVVALVALSFVSVGCVLSIVYLAPHAKDVGIKPGYCKAPNRL